MHSLWQATESVRLEFEQTGCIDNI